MEIKMDKQQADKIITAYLPKIFGFAAEHSFYHEETEELASDIVEEVYLSLRRQEQIYHMDGYIYRISRHVYAKYVAARRKQGVSINGMEFPYEQEFLPEDSGEEFARLRREITYLSKIRRKIVYAFYFENKTVACIAEETGIPQGTVKWHLNKARHQLKGGLQMERKVGRLGINPVEEASFGHGGNPGRNNRGPEYYLEDRLNLNIVYSVYFEPKKKEEIAQELAVNLAFIEDRITYLENNGFLVRCAGDRFTTYVMFSPESYSMEKEEKVAKKKMEMAELLVAEYVPAVREAIKDVKEIYIPGGNRELLECAAVIYGILNKCQFSIKKDLSPYKIKTEDGGEFVASVYLKQRREDPEYEPQMRLPDYSACGSMWRGPGKYPAVSAWALDVKRYCSRQGGWENNLYTDYEYLYEAITGAIFDVPANQDKFKRLRKRQFLTEDNKVNIMVAKGSQKELFSKIPDVDKKLIRRFQDYALETALADAREYPPQMRDLVVCYDVAGFCDRMVVGMVMDILYGKGMFRQLTEDEKVTTNLIMFSDVLPPEEMRKKECDGAQESGNEEAG